ncbi:Histidinol-phosphatase [alternative form] [hydrothermal vent metagenome]|uniref:Histidinol-phosphatase [alternative form] n=1 Tax=hydrothermal vent metagenome TaxID=652676 RepID=A0A3B0T7I9_9ZZZZ
MKRPSPPHEDFLVFAEKLADTSREMLLVAANQSLNIDVKADASFVTDTDKAIEKRMREMIIHAFPDHGIMGEEFANIDLDAEFVWVLDPIDGTAPFIAGIPVYGTLIGLAWKGKPFVGVMDHPATLDRWTGVANRFAKRNGQPAKVKPCADLSKAFVTCSSPDFMSKSELARFNNLRKQVPYVQYGGSCFAYGMLASGRTDIAIDCGYEPFDVFANAAVISGAGGHMSDWNGQDITLNWSGQVIAAGDKTCLRAALDALTPE